MTWFDLFAAILIAMVTYLGYRIGAVRQISGLLGAVAGIILVLLVVAIAADTLAVLDPTARAITVLIALVVVTIVGQNVGSILGSKLADGEEKGTVGVLNRVVGGLVGVVEGLVIVWLVTSLTAMVPDPLVAESAQRSKTAELLAEVAPPPETVAQNLTDSLADTDLGYLFDGIAPAPTSPTDLPSNKEVRAVAEKAAASTVKILSSGCSLQGVGSGVVIAPEYVVTNAHVVAGGGFIRVEKNGYRIEATPVRIDTGLDAALLHVPGLTAPALEWADSDPKRGSKGAVLGYPAGGSLKASTASVSRTIDARGRSIDGASPVRRDVLELATEVNPGNSGGPFVLLNGKIGGIVFAESPSDVAVGYALAADDVEASLASAVGQTSAVPTGACVN